MPFAIELWARYPTEIEFDLSAFHHRHIGEWHQGRMSSRELFTLVVYLPEDSAYQRARRDWDWSEREYMAAATANRLAAQSGEEYVPFLSPAQRTEDIVDDDGLDEQRGNALSQMQRW